MDTLKIKNDYCGNPRFVVHFYALIDGVPNVALDIIRERAPLAIDFINRKRETYQTIGEQYNFACKVANCGGGKKYTGKCFGGGIVYQVYNEDDLAEKIAWSIVRWYKKNATKLEKEFY